MAVTRFARAGVAALALTLCLTFFFCVRAQAASQIDTAFGGGSVRIRAFPESAHIQISRGLAVQPDGKVLAPVAISSSFKINRRKPVVRYLPSGARDPGFGQDGAAWVSVPGKRFVTLFGVVAGQSGDSFVYGAYSRKIPRYYEAYDGYFVAHLDAAGLLDRSYASGGAATFPWRKHGDEYWEAFLDVDAAGNAHLIENVYSLKHERYFLRVYGLGWDGQPDPAYGGSGKNEWNLPHEADLAGVATQNGHLDLLLSSYRRSSNAVLRFDLRGGLRRDFGFGTGGVANVPDSPEARFSGFSISETRSGGVQVSGTISQKVGAPIGGVFRLTPSGATDAAFGSNGLASLPQVENVFASFDRPGGGAVAIGRSGFEESKTKFLSIGAGGALDTGFGGTGVFTFGAEWFVRGTAPSGDANYVAMTHSGNYGDDRSKLVRVVN